MRKSSEQRRFERGITKAFDASDIAETWAGKLMVKLHTGEVWAFNSWDRFYLLGTAQFKAV